MVFARLIYLVGVPVLSMPFFYVLMVIHGVCSVPLAKYYYRVCAVFSCDFCVWHTVYHGYIRHAFWL